MKPMVPGKLLNNRMILYMSLIASLINVLSFSLLGDHVIVAIFVLVAFITSFFSKNMTVILLTALATTNTIKYGTKIRVEEGYENADTVDLSGNSISKTLSKSIESVMESGSKPSATKSVAKEGLKSEEQPLLDDTKLEPGVFETKKKQMRELLDIQKALSKNMDSVEKSLNRAEVLVENLKEGMDIRRG